MNVRTKISVNEILCLLVTEKLCCNSQKLRKKTNMFLLEVQHSVILQLF